MSLSQPAIFPGSNTEEVIFLANQRFLELELLFGNLDTTIADGSITTAKLADGAVTTVKIADDAVTAAKIDVAKLSDITPDVGTLTAGLLQSTNWSTTAGMKMDLSDGSVLFGGSTNKLTSIASTGILTAKQVDISGKVFINSGGVGSFDVTGGEIVSSTIVFRTDGLFAGTGNDILSIDSDDATYRLAIGHATYGSAPFRVTKAGVLTASGATLASATISSPTISSPSISNATISGASIGGVTALALNSSATFTIASGVNVAVDAASTITFGTGATLGYSAANTISAPSIAASGAVTTITGITVNYGSSPQFFAIPGLGTAVYGMDFVVGNSGGTAKCTIVNSTGAISCGSVTATASVAATTAVTAGTTLTTGAPGLTGAGNWRLGSSASAAVALDTANYINISINGADYKLALVT